MPAARSSGFLERIARTQARLNLRNVPAVIERGLLHAFIPDLASPFLSDSLRSSILADIRQRTRDASVLQPALAALLSALDKRPVNCACSQKYIVAWLATLRLPPAPVRPLMALGELNRLLWLGAFEDGWSGNRVGGKRRYWHKSSAKRVFSCKKEARAYNDEKENVGFN